MPASPTRRRTIWRALAAAFLLLLPLMALMAWNQPFVRCQTATWHGMRAIAPGIYVPNESAPAFEACSLGISMEARRRVVSCLGSLRSTAPMLFCENTERFRFFSGSALPLSITLRTPVGDSVVVGPQGMDPVFVAHERIHTELDARVGHLHADSRLPFWFQEGLAVLASGDTRFPREEWEVACRRLGGAPPLSSLASAEDFNRIARQSGMLAYGTAYQEVAGWVARRGPEALRHLLEEVERGHPFAQTYSGAR